MIADRASVGDANRNVLCSGVISGMYNVLLLTINNACDTYVRFALRAGLANKFILIGKVIHRVNGMINEIVDSQKLPPHA